MGGHLRADCAPQPKLALAPSAGREAETGRRMATAESGRADSHLFSNGSGWPGPRNGTAGSGWTLGVVEQRFERGRGRLVQLSPAPRNGQLAPGDGDIQGKRLRRG